MNLQLKSLVVSNFRSLKGTITIPLEAPVVLLHGANGAGKTSILSAIELALTGEVLSMRRADLGYKQHLVHRGQQSAEISLAVSPATASITPAALKILPSGMLSAKPLLDPRDARFFSERVYLAQSTLSRLLEIYQHADTRTDSPLTRFVKDLLGLDQLDALIDGLSISHDIRNVRKLIPQYAAAETKLHDADVRLSQSRAALEIARNDALTAEASLRKGLTALEQPLATLMSLDDQRRLESFLRNDNEERELIETATLIREVASMRQQLNALEKSKRSTDDLGIEQQEAIARAKLTDWQRGPGTTLERTINKLRSFFPDLPSITALDPEFVYRNAVERCSSELTRLNRLVAQDDINAEAEQVLKQRLQGIRARLSIIEAEGTALSTNMQGLGASLASMIPHLTGEHCPVCDRDFHEVSDQPLMAHVASKVARLTEQSDRLQALLKARLEATTDQANSQRHLEQLVAQRLTAGDRAQTKGSVATLLECMTSLESERDRVQDGADVLRNHKVAQQELARVRSANVSMTAIRTSMLDLANKLGMAQVGDLTIPEGLALIHQYTESRASALRAAQVTRNDTLRHLEHWVQRRTQVDRLEKQIAADSLLRAAYGRSIDLADEVRASARAMAKASTDVKSNVVGKVFNESLNKVWRDLFVRLAPTEPFVPAFRVPKTPAAVSAVLETIHRDGGHGGAPGAMLSAGNLNTAALTLFIALHLSVVPQLPWLILDDPVQSMDEVHISHFAALLRTLSKEHGRQIVIAVHDRTLFDYLALELSPAFPSDKLVTVEITRVSEGDSIAEPTFHTFEPDRAVA